MDQTERAIAIGSVLRADIRGFVVASRLTEPEVPTYGTFVRAPIQQGQAYLVGLIHDITLQDDPFLRNLAVTVVDDDPQYREIIRDQRENRAIPVEIAVAAVGYTYTDSGSYLYGFPPQPPMVLHRITVCPAEEIRQITASPEFMRALLDNRDVQSDELIPVALRRAAELQPSDTRESYLLEAGRYLARYMGRDPVRLDRVLRQIALP